MWYEFFRFEINYRSKRPETYLFFLFLFLFSLFGVEFVFQGTDLGLVKKNSALVIAKSIAAITGLSMIIASMIVPFGEKISMYLAVTFIINMGNNAGKEFFHVLLTILICNIVCCLSHFVPGIQFSTEVQEGFNYFNVII